VSTRKGKDFHAEEDLVDPGLVFHDDAEDIDPFDDILGDGRVRYRSLRDAYEAYRRQRELEDEG
jgi:hypothetical protein